MRYAIVECVDSSFFANLNCIISFFSMDGKTSAKKFLLTVSKNCFIPYYQKLGIEVICIDGPFETYFKNLDSHNWNVFTYARFLIFQLIIFKSFDFILYLDTDVLMMHDIDVELEQECLNIPSLGLVNERKAYSYGNIFNIIKACKKWNLRIPTRITYGNCGVMVINSTELTDSNFSSLMQLTKYSSDFPFNDQDMINLVFNEKITSIDPKFNMFSNTYVNSYYQLNNICLNETTVALSHCAGGSLEEKYKKMISYFGNNIKTLLETKFI